MKGSKYTKSFKDAMAATAVQKYANVPGLVTVAPLRHDSDVALIAPDIEPVSYTHLTLPTIHSV
mgnify:CR=1 FL=1